MLQQQLLKKVVQILNEATIEYFFTGSIVSSLLGEPRSTHDIDIVVAALKKEDITIQPVCIWKKTLQYSAQLS